MLYYYSKHASKAKIVVEELKKSFFFHKIGPLHLPVIMYSMDLWIFYRVKLVLYRVKY